MFMQELFLLNKNTSKITQEIIIKTLAIEEKDRFSWE